MALTATNKISSSEGNLVNELDHSNPTQLLLAAIRKSGIDLNDAKKLKVHASFEGAESEHEKFYLGALRCNEVRTLSHLLCNTSVTAGIAQLSQVYRIVSGDVSRGTIALESHAAPAVGAQVQVNFFAASNLYNCKLFVSAVPPPYDLDPTTTGAILCARA